MEKTSETIERILQTYVSDDVAVVPAHAEAMLSPYLRSSYDLYRLNLLGRETLIASPVEWSGNVAGALKGITKLEDALGESVILFANALSPAQKKALIRARSGFICSDGSIFIPMLGLAIQESRSHRGVLPRQLSSSEQVCFLYCLYCEDEKILQADVAKAVGLSTSSVSRSFSMFSDAGLMEYEVGGATGRLRLYTIPDKRAFFERGSAAFGDPIREIVQTNTLPEDMHLPMGGLSALSEHSNLNPPARTTLAASPAQGKRITSDSEASAEGWRYEIQILRYDPLPFEKGGCVDPVTMLKTIDVTKDERVRIALRQAMEGCEWYVG